MLGLTLFTTIAVTSTMTIMCESEARFVEKSLLLLKLLMQCGKEGLEDHNYSSLSKYSVIQVLKHGKGGILQNSAQFKIYGLCCSQWPQRWYDTGLQISFGAGESHKSGHSRVFGKASW